MGLKLANDDEHENNGGGLRLSGVSEEQRTNTRMEQDNPWDFAKDEEPIVTRSISSSAISSSDFHSSQASDTSIIIKITGILAYLSLLVEIGGMIWIAMQPEIDVYVRTVKISPLFSACQLMMIVDAILVNVLYERKLTLILWAWLFCPVYAIKRERHVNSGASFGGLLCAGYIIATLVFIGKVFSASMEYGDVITNLDDTVRYTVVEFMEQPTPEGGETYKSKLDRSFLVDEMDCVTQGNQQVVVIQAYGLYDFSSDGILKYTSFSVPTQLCFVKDSAGQYKPAAIVVNDKKLTEKNIKYYWNTLIK